MVAIPLYDRGIRVTVTPPLPGTRVDAPIPGPIVVNPTPPTGIGFETVPQSRVVFSVQKSVTPEPQRAMISVFNLSQRTRMIAAGNGKRAIDLVNPSVAAAPVDTFFTPGDPLATSVSSGIPYLMLEAGYGANLATIFEGNNTKVRHRKLGPDWVTSFVNGEGELQLNSAIVNKTFPRGTPATVILDYAATTLGLTVAKQTAGYAALGTYTLSNGFAAFGKSRDAVAELLSPPPLRLAYFVEGSRLWILQGAEVIPGPQVNVTSQEVVAGAIQLIEAPEAIDEAGAIVRCLLAPQIQPGRLINIVSTELVGAYRCEDVSHQGDNWGGSFQTIATLRSLASLAL